jgi:hypothetical protein
MVANQSRAALRVVQKYHPNVTRVVDANRSATIEVTRRDCKVGKSKAPDSCALANAFCRKHDGAIISLRVAYLVDGNKAVRYMVPSRISREIVSFDRGQYFAPGDYRLDRPASTERLGVRRNKKSVYRKPSGKSVNRIHKTAGIRSL